MDHILAKIRGVPFTEIQHTLKNDFLEHASQGLFLEHLWQNQEQSDEVFCLFRTIDLEKARRFIDNKRERENREPAGLRAQEMVFLEGK